MNRQIEWMHPSWRDLVIDHLCSNAAARRKFLSSCGVQGFLLALSSAGGATGKRAIPLLVDSQDWRAMNDSLPAVLNSGNDASWRALDAVHDAIVANKEVESNSSELLLQLAEQMLRHLHSRWQTTPQQCTARLLLKYYELSECLWPLPPSPNLPAIWETQVESAIQEIEESDPEEVDTEYCETIEWMDLAEAVENNEPRFLRQTCFPEKYFETLRALILSLKTRISFDFEFDTEDDCSEEESRLDTFEALGWRLAKLAPKIGEAAKDIARSASTKEQTVRERRSELEEAANEARQIPPTKLKTSTPAVSVEPVNIAELFHDL
jgi:hypothetical protein